MQKMRKWFGLGIVACLLVLALAFQNRGEAQQLTTGEVYVNNQTSVTVYVTMYKNRQIVRSVSLRGRNQYGYDTTWQGIPVGAYEVLIEAVGYGKILKQFVVAASPRGQLIVDNLTRNDQLWGAGPSLLVLQARITALEADNRAIKARILRLETAR